MAKLTGAYYGRRKPAVGKAFYVRELRGQLLLCKWPRKRGRPLHPTTREQNEKFRQANWLAKYAPAAIQMAHRTVVEGTSLLPRDLMIASMYGRGFDFVIPGARRRYPVAARQDLTDTLDILGALAGGIIARGPDQWEGVSPTQAGQALISGPTGQAPTYQTIGSQDGLWVQVEDVTLPADLALNAFHDTVIAGNWNAIEYQALLKGSPSGQQPLMRFNDDAGLNYQGSLIAQVVSAAPVGYGYAANSVVRLIRPTDAPMTGNFLITLRIVHFLDTEQLQITMTLGNSSQNQCIGQYYWLNQTANPLTKISIMSSSGVGLRKNTRIMLRAVFP